MPAITVEMPPFAKARPRVSRSKSGRSHTYMPPEYVTKKDMLRLLYQVAGGELDIPGPVNLWVGFFFKTPKSWTKAKTAEETGRYHMSRPDLDNLVGGVMDALLEDDSKVVAVTAFKRWSDADAIKIRIEPALDIQIL